MIRLTVVMLVALLMVVDTVHTAVINNDTLCFQQVNGSSCTTQQDCHCPQTFMMCSRDRQCVQASVPVITSLLPCPLIYKTRCSFDADCNCAEAKLICEQKECVRFRKKNHVRDI